MNIDKIFKMQKFRLLLMKNQYVQSKDRRKLSYVETFWRKDTVSLKLVANLLTVSNNF